MNTTLFIIIIISLTILCAIYSYSNKLATFSMETFSNSSPYTNTALMGFNESSPPYNYKTVDYNLTKPVSNIKELNSLKAETRHPELIKQRYTYNDIGGHQKDNRVYDYAYLHDLPLNLNINCMEN